MVRQLLRKAWHYLRNQRVVKPGALVKITLNDGRAVQFSVTERMRLDDVFKAVGRNRHDFKGSIEISYPKKEPAEQ